MWIVKGVDDVEEEIHEEAKIKLFSGGADAIDETQQLMISVSVDADHESQEA